MRHVSADSQNWLCAFGLALVFASTSASAADRPTNKPLASYKAQLPDPAVPQPLLGRARSLNVSGEWLDSYRHVWTLQQVDGTINGTFYTNPTCGTWRVRGAITSTTEFTLLATNPDSGNGCALWARYRLSRTSGTRAIGHWDNSTGAMGDVTMRLRKPVPVEFEQVGDAIVEPGAELTFRYRWRSSSGDIADLSRCVVGERVVYPGTANPYHWPSPPWTTTSTAANPSIIWLLATDGRAIDSHIAGGFLRPYRSARFTAKQNYRFKCTYLPSTYVFPGWRNVAITRRVWDRTGRGCWMYLITKTGSRAFRRLPGINAGRCSTATPETVAQSLSDSTDDGDVGMSVSLSNATVGLNEPIFADLTIFNRRDAKVDFDLGLNRKANLELRIETPSGGVEIRRLSSHGFGRSGALVLGPNEAFTETFVLNEWYQFPEPGIYRVTMNLSERRAGAGRIAERASTKFSVHVGPRNQSRLERIAGELADRAILGPSIAERMDAANALGFTLDPAAVDSLVRVLQQGELVEHHAAAGLARIGNSKAMAALIAAAHHHPDDDVRATAQAMVRMLEERGQAPPPASD